MLIRPQKHLLVGVIIFQRTAISNVMISKYFLCLLFLDTEIEI